MELPHWLWTIIVVVGASIALRIIQKEIDKKKDYETEMVFEASDEMSSAEQIVAWRLVDQNDLIRYLIVICTGIFFAVLYIAVKITEAG